MPSKVGGPFKRHFEDDGFICTLAESGLYALTMLEHHTPDIMVSVDQLEDMEGFDLLGIMHSDETFKSIPFVLLQNHNKPVTDSVAGPYFPLPDNVSPRELLTAIRLRLGMGISSEPKRYEIQGAQMHGTLESFDLSNIITTVSSACKVGQLFVRTDGGDAFLAFVDNVLVHAEYRDLIGVKAVIALFHDVQGRPHTEFFFRKDAHPEKSTMNMEISRLLLAVAVELDHEDKDEAKLTF